MIFRVRRTHSARAPYLTPDKLLNNQIQELSNKIDNMNMELTSVLKNTADIVKNIKTLESSGASPDLLERRRKQHADANTRKQNIMKKLKLLETELARKEKERSSS